MVGARVPLTWQQQIQEIAVSSGRKEAEVVREALAQYLGQTDPASVKGALALLEDRVGSLERKLSGLGRLVRGNENSSNS
jgi:RHH-type rel operon transcriptional repressor/antitoxin RelB